MLGASMFAYEGGEVTVTATDASQFAPNDEDLGGVLKAMERQLRDNTPHLTFNVETPGGVWHVEVGVDEYDVLRRAAMPLQANKRIHP